MLEPFEEQKGFVAENIQSLAEAYATRNEGNNAVPLAVYSDVDLIGFVMIGKGTVGNMVDAPLTLTMNNNLIGEYCINKSIYAFVDTKEFLNYSYFGAIQLVDGNVNVTFNAVIVVVLF